MPQPHFCKVWLQFFEYFYASHCGIPFCGKIPLDWTQGIWADRKGLMITKAIVVYTSTSSIILCNSPKLDLRKGDSHGPQSPLPHTLEPIVDECSFVEPRVDCSLRVISITQREYT